jgi:hypothetical protein
MVRIIVGTLIEIGHGKRDTDAFLRAFSSRSRLDLGVTAPPHGLELTRVFYPEEAFRDPESVRWHDTEEDHHVADISNTLAGQIRRFFCWQGRIIMRHGGNIPGDLQQSRGRPHALCGVADTPEQEAIAQELSDAGYLTEGEKSRIGRAHGVGASERPGTVLPIMEALSRQRINISTSAPRKTAREKQFFKMGCS